ncbi:MAG: hypothetical protein ACI89J_003123, partial [Hyphomicrobiaceae bacterium]
RRSCICVWLAQHKLADATLMLSLIFLYRTVGVTA